MSNDFEQLKEWINEMAMRLEANAEPDSMHYTSFLHDPKLITALVDLIDALPEEETESERSYYSACVFALDICVAQLQSAAETGSKSAGKLLEQLMNYLAAIISKNAHSLSFWLPVLNAFYDVHVELSDKLRDAYLDLAGQEEEIHPSDEINHLDAIRNMITELSDLSTFDIAENFFAQSYAMPADFFADLIIDLYNIEEGRDIALLALLHPKKEVREIVVAAHEHIINDVIISSRSLTRLQTIKNWYPPNYENQFNRWIRIQRKKGVVFHQDPITPISYIKASEVDGSGAQGIFIHIKKARVNRLCGLLFKQEVGIKDAWITPPMSAIEVARYYDEAFDSSVTLRKVDNNYLLTSISHFLSLTIQKGQAPDLHLLEMQELLGLHFHPKSIDVDETMTDIAVQISPFTHEEMQKSFKRSKAWIDYKQFAESWYIENAHVDKLVNRCSSFVDGVKLCVVSDAIDEVIEHELELQRSKWLFHFLWVTLWLKAHSDKREKVWQDCFFIAHGIHSGLPLREIPVMQEIARQTVLNSIETMTERRTHLTKE